MTNFIDKWYDEGQNSKAKIGYNCFDTPKLGKVEQLAEVEIPEVLGVHDCHASPEDGCKFCFEHGNTL